MKLTKQTVKKDASDRKDEVHELSVDEMSCDTTKKRTNITLRCKVRCHEIVSSHLGAIVRRGRRAGAPHTQISE
jgi:hypothetical protein